MEDNIQVIVGIIISVFLLFIFPVYMAYEKVDDISYALAMRYTQDFVDDVRRNGYLTKEMLADYKERLRVTGNSYQIELTHKQTRMDPVTYYYRTEGDKQVLLKTTTQEERKEYEELIIDTAIELGYLYSWSSQADKKFYIDTAYNTYDIDRVVDTYQVSEEIYTTEHIEAVLATENKLWMGATTDNFVCIDDDEEEDLESVTKRVKGCEYVYTMNEDDDFNVTIKNTNTTLATVIYNMVTANTVDNNSRIYVNYGGTILNTKWYGKIDYSKMKHDDLNLDNLKEHIIFLESRLYNRDEIGIEYIKGLLNLTVDEYVIEFEAKPMEVTELREKGYIVQSDEYELYNFAVGRQSTVDSLGISVGLNGIALVLTPKAARNTPQVILSYPTSIAGFRKIKVKVQKSSQDDTKYVVILYLDDVRVAESMLLDSTPHIYRVGEGYVGTKKYGYSGYLRNVIAYY